MCEGPEQGWFLLRIGDIQDKIRAQELSCLNSASEIITELNLLGLGSASGTTAPHAESPDQDRAPAAWMVGISRKNPGVRYSRLEIHIVNVRVVLTG